MQDAFIVGQRYPYPEHLSGPHEGAVAVLDNTFFHAVIAGRDWSKQEVRAFREGPIRYGLLSIYPPLWQAGPPGTGAAIPFLLLEFVGVLQVEATINIHKIQDSAAKDAWLRAEANLLPMMLVDSGTGRVEAIRAIGLRLDVCQALKAALSEQRDHYPTAHAVDAAMQSVVASHTTAQMIAKARMFRL